MGCIQDLFVFLAVRSYSVEEVVACRRSKGDMRGYGLLLPMGGSVRVIFITMVRCRLRAIASGK